MTGLPARFFEIGLQCAVGHENVDRRRHRTSPPQQAIELVGQLSAASVTGDLHSAVADGQHF